MQGRQWLDTVVVLVDESNKLQLYDVLTMKAFVRYKTKRMIDKFKKNHFWAPSCFRI